MNCLLKPAERFQTVERHFHVLSLRGTRFWSLVLLGACAWLISPLQVSLRAEEFRWTAATGDRFSVELTQKMTATSNCDSKQRVETSEALVRMQWTVTGVEEDRISTEQVIESVSLRLGTTTADGSGLIDLNTDSKQALTGVAENLRQQLLAMKDARFTVVYRPDGTLVSVAVDPATAERFREAPATSPLRDLFSESGMIRWFGQTQMVLPAGDIAPGYKWKSGTPPAAADGSAPASSDPPTAPNPDAAAAGEPLLNWSYAGKTNRNGRELRRFTCSNPDQAINRKSEGELKKWTVNGEYLFDPGLGLPASGSVTTQVVLKSRFRELEVETTVDTVTSMTLIKN